MTEHTPGGARWEKKIGTPKWGSLLANVRDAIGAAYDNANDTHSSEDAYKGAEWWAVAYASIPFTSAFDGDAKVRAWFSRNGYSW